MCLLYFCLRALFFTFNVKLHFNTVKNINQDKEIEGAGSGNRSVRVFREDISEGVKSDQELGR